MFSGRCHQIDNVLGVVRRSGSEDGELDGDVAKSQKCITRRVGAGIAGRMDKGFPNLQTY